MWFVSPRTLLLRGVVTSAFGIFLMTRPAISVEVFVLAVGAFALIEGALIIAAGATIERGERGRGIWLLAGAFGVAIGVVTFLWPGVTQLAVVLLVALRALLLGAAELTLATSVAGYVGPRSPAVWPLGFAGVLSLVFGAVLLIRPTAALLALAWAVGLYALVVGILLIVKA